MMLRVTFRDVAKLIAVGIVVTDLERAVKFYRLLGVPIADGAVSSEHGHVDATLDGGMRVLMDTEDEMRKVDPSWKRAGGSPAAKLALECERPKAGDQLCAKALSIGSRGQ